MQKFDDREGIKIETGEDAGGQHRRQQDVKRQGEYQQQPGAMRVFIIFHISVLLASSQCENRLAIARQSTLRAKNSSAQTRE
ncbi:hypothetical protein QEP77_08875 [Serratia sp. B1]|nr:hypothetical protein QEP77_08875 [Serratia sp. B1]